MATKTVPATVAFNRTEINDEITRDLSRATAVIGMLVHVFGGDADTDEPSKLPGLAESIAAAARYARSGSTNLYLLKDNTAEPGRLEEVAALCSEGAGLMEMVERQIQNSADGVRFCDAWMCDYFDAAAGLIEKAEKQFSRPAAEVVRLSRSEEVLNG